MADLYALFVQFFQFPINHFTEQAHQSMDFFEWARPIFCRKGVERQIRNVELDRGADDAAQVFSAGTMTSNARQSVGLCPASIAIHDDGDMSQFSHKNAPPLASLLRLP